MTDLDTMEFRAEEDESYTTSIMQCQNCGSEVEDDEELCCDDPQHEMIHLDQDGDELEYEF